MTISPDIENGPFVGNGAQLAFAFTFTAVTSAEIVVLLDGVAQTTGYTVSLAANGGTVTFAAPPAAGAQIVLRSNPDYLQDSVFENEGAYNLATVNTINRRHAVRALVTKKRLEATSVAAADASADAAAASAAAAAGAASVASDWASAAAGSAGAAGTSAASAAGSASAAAGSVNSAALAAATAGAYPNSAASYVPRGLTQASVGAITGGSGGANGTFALSWSGGNFAVNPTGTFTVAGGAVTAVTITGPGLHIGATATVPTPSFAASTGLTGAAVTLTAQFLVANGTGYWVQSADNTQLLRYANVSGTATAVSGVGPVPIDGGGALTLANAIVKGRGRRNLFRDPFHRSSRLPDSMPNLLNSESVFYPSSGGWTAAPAGPSNPYRDTYEIRGLANGYKLFHIVLPRLGLTTGSAFALAFEIATSGYVSILAQYRGADGSYIGTTMNWASGVVGRASGKAFKSGDLTVPAGATGIDFSIYCSADFQILSRWGHLGTAADLPDSPIDEVVVPRAYDRLVAAEAQLPSNTGLTLKTVTYSGRSVAVTGAPSAPAFNPYNGFGVILDTASIPAGFNALEITGGLVWEPGYNPPSTIYAVIRAGVGSEVPFIGGRLVAIGSITVDPTSGSIPTRAVLLHDPVSGEQINPSTILASCGDHIGIGIYGINADDVSCERLYANRGTTAYSSSGSTFGGYWRTTGFGDIGAWAQTYGDGSVALSLVNLTNPKEVYTTPSDSFSAAVASRVDEAPALIACPPKVYGIVGRPTQIYWKPMMQRDYRRVNFNPVYNTVTPAGSGPREEGWALTPTSAGTSTLTVNASRGDILSDTKTITFQIASASAASGTKRLLAMGDSLVEGGAGQAAITALSAADGVTNVINVGTKGSGVNKAEGYSGQPLTAFLAATILSGSGSIANPFYNPATSRFDFAYYVTNSLGGTAPTHIILQGGFWEVSHAATDNQAGIGAATWAATAETIIASVAAYNTANGTSIKTAVWTQPLQADAGQDGQDPSSIGAAAGQLRRNMRVLAAKAISQFSGRESSLVYVVPAGTCMDAETAYPRAAYAPKNDAVAARYNGTPYATYTAMVADLAPNDETVTYCTEVSRYFIKEGPSTKGRWRGADESDGFVRRITDGIHISTGWRQLAQQIFAWIKNVG